MGKEIRRKYSATVPGESCVGSAGRGQDLAELAQQFEMHPNQISDLKESILTLSDKGMREVKHLADLDEGSNIEFFNKPIIPVSHFCHPWRPHGKS